MKSVNSFDKIDREIQQIPFVINSVSCILLASAVFGISNAILIKNIFSIPVSLLYIFLGYNLFLRRSWARDWIVLINKVLIGIAGIALILFLLSIPFSALSKLIGYFCTLPDLSELSLENNWISTQGINALVLAYTGIIQPLTIILLLNGRGSVSKAFYLGIMIHIIIPFGFSGYSYFLKPKNYFVFEDKAISLGKISDQLGKYYFSSETFSYSISASWPWKLIKDEDFINIYASSMDDYRKEINYEVILINANERILSPISLYNVPDDFTLNKYSQAYIDLAPEEFILTRKNEFIVNDNTVYQLLFESKEKQSYVLRNVIWRDKFGVEITTFADNEKQLDRIIGGLEEIFGTVHIY